jgi:hypothetical protein
MQKRSFFALSVAILFFFLFSFLSLSLYIYKKKFQHFSFFSFLFFSFLEFSILSGTLFITAIQANDSKEMGYDRFRALVNSLNYNTIFYASKLVSCELLFYFSFNND